MILISVPREHRDEFEAEWGRLAADGGVPLASGEAVESFDGFHLVEYVLEASSQVVSIVVSIAAYLVARRGSVSIGGINVANADPKTIEAAIRAAMPEQDNT